MTYREWFDQQTPERQQYSREHMLACGRYGNLQRSLPSGEECEALRKQIAAYYERFAG